MPLSNKIIGKETADSLAINYEPKTIDSMMSDQVTTYAKNQDARGDFRVDKVVSEFVGIDKIEREAQQREIAQEALKLTKDIEEKAYEEAYALGLKEGTEQAFAAEKLRIEQEMNNFKTLVEEIKALKTSLATENEKHIVRLCFYMSKRLLMKEIQENEEYVTTLIKKSLEMAQSEEEVTIRMSEADKNWIDLHEKEVFKELSLDPSTRIEADKSIQPGGIVVETNYGVIDATIEQRLEKLEGTITK